MSGTDSEVDWRQEGCCHDCLVGLEKLEVNWSHSGEWLQAAALPCMCNQLLLEPEDLLEM